MLRLDKLSPRSFDWKLFVCVILLVVIGLAAIYSVDLSRGSELAFFKKQLLAFGLGLVLLFSAAFSRHTVWRLLAKWFYLASLALLAAVLFFGQTIRGTKGWFSVFGFSFQPVEFAKVALILILAYIIANFGRRFERPLFFIGTFLVTCLLAALVMFQPDLGSALLLAGIWFGLMLIVNTRKLFILSFVLICLVGGVMGWFFVLKDYQKERLLTFVDPNRDPLGSGYNITQSIIAVGSGKFFGRGLGFGSQSQLKFLPEAQTDFVFSVIAEELGFAGVLALLTLFGIIFWRLIILLREADDDFTAGIAAGALILLFIQLLINIGANLGILPVTGVTLPFVSYGGSSLIIGLFMIGILESAFVKRY